LIQTKVSKSATEGKRFATDKIDASLRPLDGINRAGPKLRDSRLFPGTYAPIEPLIDGRRAAEFPTQGIRESIRASAYLVN
jgi:hypothetical protein